MCPPDKRHGTVSTVAAAVVVADGGVIVTVVAF